LAVSLDRHAFLTIRNLTRAAPPVYQTFTYERDYSEENRDQRESQ